MRIAISKRLAIDDWPTAATYVEEAERLGADDVWSAEAWGHDAVTPLAYLAARTTRIRLGTGIMQAGTRTPALVAMTAMSLSAMSDRRFVLGLGVSGPQVIEGWHGVVFDRPVQRMREIIEIVRLVARGERLSYQGQVYQLPLPNSEGKALRSGAPAVPPIPVYLATLSPKLGGVPVFFDGWAGRPRLVAALLLSIAAVARARYFMPASPRLLDPVLTSGDEMLRIAFENGRFAVTGATEGGRIAKDAPADLLVLDWTKLSAEVVEPDVPAVELLFAKARQEHVKQLFVGGREIVRNGVVTGVDLPALEAELLATLRQSPETTADIRAAMPELRAALRSHYCGPLYCA